MLIETEVRSQACQNQPSGFIRAVKQRFRKYWWRDTRRNNCTTSDQHFDAWSGGKVISKDAAASGGWLRYSSLRELWAAPSSHVNSPAHQELTQRIVRSKVKPVRPIRTKSMESVIPTNKNGDVPHRTTGIRRSLSVPSSEAAKIKAAIHKPDRQNIRGGRITSFHSPEERIGEQAKDFCRDYIVFKLKCNGLLNRTKIARGHACDQWLMQEIYVICSELERRNPNLCKNLSKQIGITLRSEEVLRKVFFEFAVEIVTTDATPKEKCHRRQSGTCSSSSAETKSTEKAEKTEKTVEITWGRIMAVIVIAGALAIDCVKQGHSELVNELIEYCGEFFFEEGVVEWIAHQGGWESLSEFNICRKRDTDATSTWNIVLITACVAASLVLGVGISNLTAVGV